MDCRKEEANLFDNIANSDWFKKLSEEEQLLLKAHGVIRIGCSHKKCDFFLKESDCRRVYLRTFVDFNPIMFEVCKEWYDMRFKEIANKRGFLIRDCYFTELSKHEICDIRLSMVEELQERLVGCKTDVPRLYELIAIPKSEYNYLKSWNNTFYFDRSRKYDDISCIFGTQKFGRFSLDEYLHVFPIMVKAWINGYVFPERFWDELKITTKQMIKNSKTNSKRELYNKLDSFFWGERDKQSVERFTELSAEILRILSKLKFVEL